MVATAEIAAEIVAAGNAREAVLELHSFTEDAYGHRTCDECSDPEGYMHVPYPCATASAVQINAPATEETP